MSFNFKPKLELKFEIVIDKFLSNLFTARAPEELPGAPPKFVKLLSDLLIGEGETAIFECIVTSEPKPDITWFLNNEEILEDETRTV